MGDPVSAYRIKPQGEHSERMKELDTRLEKIERDYAVAVHEADAAASGDDPSSKSALRLRKRQRELCWDRTVERCKRIAVTPDEALTVPIVQRTLKTFIVAKGKRKSDQTRLTLWEVNQKERLEAGGKTRDEDKDTRYRKARRAALRRLAAPGKDRIKGETLLHFVKEYAKEIVSLDREGSRADSYSSWEANHNTHTPHHKGSSRGSDGSDGGKRGKKSSSSSSGKGKGKKGKKSSNGGSRSTDDDYRGLATADGDGDDTYKRLREKSMKRKKDRRHSRRRAAPSSSSSSASSSSRGGRSHRSRSRSRSRSRGRSRSRSWSGWGSAYGSGWGAPWGSGYGSGFGSARRRRRGRYSRSGGLSSTYSSFSVGSSSGGSYSPYSSEFFPIYGSYGAYGPYGSYSGGF